MNVKKDALDALFNRLKGEFDTEAPATGHRERFLEKLGAGKRSKKQGWLKPLSIAASVVILLGLGTGIFYTNSGAAGGRIDPEIKKTQFYFTALLQEEVEKLNAQDSPETRQIIADALAQLDKLEDDYEHLENDLRQNGNSKRLLNAMIVNFQTRINLLQDVLTQIDEIKNFKNNKNETTII